MKDENKWFILKAYFDFEYGKRLHRKTESRLTMTKQLSWAHCACSCRWPRRAWSCAWSSCGPPCRTCWRTSCSRGDTAASARSGSSRRSPAGSTPCQTPPSRTLHKTSISFDSILLTLKLQFIYYIISLIFTNIYSLKPSIHQWSINLPAYRTATFISILVIQLHIKVYD